MKEVATLRSFKTVPVFLHNGPTVSCVCVCWQMQLSVQLCGIFWFHFKKASKFNLNSRITL